MSTATKATPTFLLAFDHRGSYRKALPDADNAKLAAGKSLVVAAVNQAVARLGPQAGVGILIDHEYGAGALSAADPAAVTAVSIERSGQAVFEFDTPDWRDRLDELDPTYGKVLIRYRADDPAAERETQRARLVETAEFLRQTGRRFLLEVLTPLTPDETVAAQADLDAVRLPLLLAAIAELQEAGLDPELWKVEGLDQLKSCAAVAAQCRSNRDSVRVVVLGAGAPEETVTRWLAAAAGGGYDGFAVGRSIWLQPITDWHASDIDQATAIEQVVTNYQTCVDAFNAAR